MITHAIGDTDAAIILHPFTNFQGALLHITVHIGFLAFDLDGMVMSFVLWWPPCRGFRRAMPSPQQLQFIPLVPSLYLGH